MALSGQISWKQSESDRERERWRLEERRRAGGVRSLTSRCSSSLHLTPNETRSRNAPGDHGQVYVGGGEREGAEGGKEGEGTTEGEKERGVCVCVSVRESSDGGTKGEVACFYEDQMSPEAE